MKIMKRPVKSNESSLMFLSNSLEINTNICRQEQEVLSSNSVGISNYELDLVADHCRSGNSSGTKTNEEDLRP